MKKVLLFESFIAENEKETAKEIFDELMDVNGEEIADIDSQEAMTILSRRGIRGGKANKIAKELLKLTSAIGESVVNEAKSFSESELKSTAQSVADAVAKVYNTKANLIEFEMNPAKGRVAGFYVHKATNKKGAPSRYWITDSGEVVSAFRNDTFGDGVVGKVGSSVADFIKTFKANESVANESVVNESDAALKKENKNWLIQPEPLHPNLSKKNLAKLKKLGHTGMKSAILWTDGHSSNPTYIQIPGEVGTPWGSKGPEDRTTFYWDGENVWCTNYPKETLRIDYKKSVDTAKEFSDATKSISDSGKWDKVKKM